MWNNRISHCALPADVAVLTSFFAGKAGTISHYFMHMTEIENILFASMCLCQEIEGLKVANYPPKITQGYPTDIVIDAITPLNVHVVFPFDD